nr:hypothetical protein [Tanacetum cinerariifolium]
GLNRALKQSEVRHVVNENQLSVCAIIESHVDLFAISTVCSRVFCSWNWTSNANLCTKGYRIILGWNVDVVNVMVLSQTTQIMHVKVNYKATNKIIFCSFIYASNLPAERRLLWANLGLHKNVVRGCPWILMGDFNVALNLEDNYSVSSSLNSAMYEFKDCVSKTEVMDVNSTGLHYNWNQKPKGGGGKLKKLDRIMGNLDFLDTFLVHDHGNLHDRVNKLRLELDEVQKALDRNPDDAVLKEEEAVYVKSFAKAKIDEERFLKQKVKVEWLEVGDCNSTYFHKSVEIRNQRSRIEVIRDADNAEITGSLVADAFVSHYHQFLGTTIDCDELVMEGLFEKKVSDTSNLNMVRHITNEYIKAAMSGIGDGRSPGPDGYTSAFFKKSWDILGSDICNDLFIFARGEIESSHLIMKSFGEFQRTSGLVPSIPKSTTYFCNVRNHVKHSILSFMPFVEGEHPVKYLGVPLVSSQFLTRIVRSLSKELRTVLGSRRISLYRLLVGFNYQRIVNLCFTDDLFLFARGHPNSVRVIIDALEEFKNVSGLVPSIPKSTAFFCNVPTALKASIFSSMPFAECILPVKYLGVPLISFRLLYRDCKVLVEKLESRVNDWRNKFLSLAEQLMRGFLWCQVEMKKGNAKVAWEAVCLPYREGGLGIRRLDDFNVALMATHVWCILINKESLWVQWIHSYKLNGRIFWDVPCLGDVSWGWRKLLQIRTRIRPFIWHKINNGRFTSMWFDRWAYPCPLRDMLTVRNIVRSGFSLSNTVSVLISNGSWRWPHDWSARFPNVVNIPAPDINHELDDKSNVDQIVQLITTLVQMKLVTLKFKKMTTGSRLLLDQWKIPSSCFDHDRSSRYLTPRDITSAGFNIKNCVVDLVANGGWLWPQAWLLKSPDLGLVPVPTIIDTRHAFHLWLVMRNNLKTQDKLRQWDVGVGTDLNLLQCAFGSSQMDSHAHLFFECPYSSKVLKLVRPLALMENVPPYLHDILLELQPIAHR